MSNPEFPSNPWGETEVVWLIPTPGNTEPRESVLKRLVNEPNRTHIVRQIHVVNPILPQFAPSTLSEAEDTLAFVEQELDALEECGVEIARPSWHIIPRSDQAEYPDLSQRFLHILARVPVVDGDHPSNRKDVSHIPVYEIEGLTKSIIAYLNQVKLHAPYLYDIKRLSQYLHGTMRVEAQTTPKRPIMVDPDVLIEMNDGKTYCISDLLQTRVKFD